MKYKTDVTFYNDFVHSLDLIEERFSNFRKRSRKTKHYLKNNSINVKVGKCKIDGRSDKLYINSSKRGKVRFKKSVKELLGSLEETLGEPKTVNFSKLSKMIDNIGITNLSGAYKIDSNSYFTKPKKRFSKALNILGFLDSENDDTKKTKKLVDSRLTPEKISEALVNLRYASAKPWAPNIGFECTYENGKIKMDIPIKFKPNSHALILASWAVPFELFYSFDDLTEMILVTSLVETCVSPFLKRTHVSTIIPRKEEYALPVMDSINKFFGRERPNKIKLKAKFIKD